MIYFCLELPLSSFFKFNFDGSVLNNGVFGKESFVIANLSSMMVVVAYIRLFDITVSITELRVTWKCIVYVTKIL